MVFGQETTITFLYQLGLIILFSQLAAEVFRRLNLPGLIGAILSGAIIGPQALGIISPGLVEPGQPIALLGTLGTILILFVAGSEFEAEAFLKSGRAAFLLTTTGVALTLSLVYVLGILLQWSPVQALIMGVILAPSGTSVVASVLTDEERAGSRPGETTLTGCIIDDVEAIILITAVLSLAAGTTDFPVSGMAIIIAVATALVLLAIFVGVKVFPRIMPRLDRLMSDDTLFAVFLSMGLLLAVGASFVGLAAITGAFLMGMVIPTHKTGERLANRMRLTKDVFAAIFFAIVGMNLDPSTLVATVPLAIAFLATGIAARIIGGVLGGRAGGLRGSELKTAVLGLATRAEMSLIIAAQAVELGLVSVRLIDITVVAVILSIITMLPLFRRGLVREPAEIIRPGEPPKF